MLMFTVRENLASNRQININAVTLRVSAKQPKLGKQVMYASTLESCYSFTELPDTNIVQLNGNDTDARRRSLTHSWS